jgi:hypothetical protein
MLPSRRRLHGVHTVILASAASTAALTVGLATYAALIFAGIAVAIYDVRRHRRGRAIAATVMVGLLTLLGLVIAIVSSVA